MLIHHHGFRIDFCVFDRHHMVCGAFGVDYEDQICVIRRLPHISLILVVLHLPTNSTTFLTGCRCKVIIGNADYCFGFNCSVVRHRYAQLSMLKSVYFHYGETGLCLYFLIVVRKTDIIAQYSRVVIYHFNLTAGAEPRGQRRPWLSALDEQKAMR